MATSSTQKTPETTDTSDPEQDPEQDSDFNTDAHFENNTDERHTPTKLIRQLLAAIGGLFDLDPCSGCEPIQIAKTRYTEEDDGLSQPWFGRVFCNPPYSEIEDWMEKIVNEMNRPDGPEMVVALIPARTSTQWFHNSGTEAEILGLVEGRLTFGGTENSAPFPSALCVFGDVPEDVEKLLAMRGVVYEKKDVLDASEQTRLDDLFESAEDEPETHELTLAAARRGTWVEVDFDDRSLGFPSGIPSDAGAKVLDSRLEGDRREVIAVSPGAFEGPEELYVLLTHPVDDPEDVRACVEHQKRSWTDVSVAEVSVQKE